uniref:Putative conserved plasma membrane protein n=1 Tax=Culex tarsalis TaxID=7177 RepID=A0A1Q3FTR5_CULTA
MAKYNVVIILLLTGFMAIADCDPATDKFCKHITCSKADKECTKPLKANAFCACEYKNGAFVKSYSSCPGPTVFNGANNRCEPKSKEAKLYCKNQQKKS